MRRKFPLWAHITLGIILGFSLLAIGWTTTVAYIAKKEVEEFNRQVQEANQRAREEDALIEAQRKAKAEARARAEEQARLLALAEQQKRKAQQDFIAKRSLDFENWYEENIPNKCKPDYKMSEITTDFVECVNHKMRAEREFNYSYRM